MKPSETLLIIRQNIIRLYKHYEVIILILFKFILMFATLSMIISASGEAGALNKIEFVLFLSLAGALLPEKWAMLGLVLLVPLHIMITNLVLGIVAFIFLWVLYLLFIRLFPKESLLIAATLICFNIGAEGVLPVVAGLFGGYIGVLAIIIGTFIWFAAPQLVMLLQPNGDAKDELLGIVASLNSSSINTILSNQTMLCSIVVFFVVFSIVYVIRKQSIDYAPYLAIVIGLTMYLAGFLLAILFLNINISMVHIFITVFLIILIAVPLQFLSRVLDYQRVETVDFEDDDNYYYVKVIPKIHVYTGHKKVKRIYNTKADTKDYTGGISISPVYRDEDTGIND